MLEYLTSLKANFFKKTSAKSQYLFKIIIFLPYNKTIEAFQAKYINILGPQ